MNCYIFDLDGVVTSVTEKRIVQTQILFYFAKLLQEQHAVAINTGRSLDFIQKQVIIPFSQYLTEKNLPANLLDNFFAVGEKGNAFLEDNKEHFDMAVSVPETIVAQIRNLTNDYTDTMFFDTTKHTMISLEITTGLDLTLFAKAKEQITPQLQKILQENHADDFKIDPSISAIDIENKNAGKAKGTKQMLSWLSKKQVEPTAFFCFGDSNADMGMGEELTKQKKNFTFVFVGEPNIIAKQPEFPIVFTKEKYEAGVMEYLRAIV